MSRDKIIEIVDSCINQDIDTVESPELIARCAQKIIDPENTSPVLAAYATNLYLREIARSRLRRAFDPTESQDSEQVEMFEKLQDKYPVHRMDADGCKGFQYAPRMQMTYEERMFNVDRLQKEIFSKQKHVDALLAETTSLLDSGFFGDVEGL